MSEIYIWSVVGSFADFGSEFLTGGTGRCASGGIASAIFGPRDDPPPSAGIVIAWREIWIAFPANEISSLAIWIGGRRRPGIWTECSQGTWTGGLSHYFSFCV